jgi:hypothetical protein
MLEQRVTRLERQMSDLQRLFKIATGPDENLREHSELLRGLIAECPGLSQRGLCFTARQRHELSKGRVIELLRLGVGKFWTEAPQARHRPISFFRSVRMLSCSLLTVRRLVCREMPR